MSGSSIRGILHIFFGEKSIRSWWVLGCLLVASLMEGLSLAGLLPLLSVATGTTGGESGPAYQLIERVLGVFGLSPTLGSLILLVITGIILKSILTLGVMRYVGYAVSNVATNLRVQLIDRLLNVRWSYFINRPLGQITNAFSVDATRAGQAYLMAATYLSMALKTAVYGGVALLVSWQFAIVAMVFAGGISLVLNHLVRVSKRAGRRQTERTSDLVTYLSDTLGNVKPLKAMAKQDAFEHLVHRKIDSLRKALRKQVLSRELLKNVGEMLVAVGLGLGFYVAVAVWRVGVLELLVAGVVLERTITNFRKMQVQLQNAVILESAYLATKALIADAEAASEGVVAGIKPTFARSCRFERVSFAHDHHVILRDASFELTAGTLSVIMGRSGAGKTTITDLIIGFYEPDQGRVLIDDVPLDKIDRNAWRGMIGYVPQELILFHDTIQANITLGDPRATEADVRAALEAAGAWDFVSALPDGVMTQVGEKGIRFSGGQRQRMALARALLAKPKLLILDEVTSALDPRTEQDICRNIAALKGEMTIVAISHRPVFTETADHIFHLEDARVRTLARPQPDVPARDKGEASVSSI